ncbi:MFS transporter [Oceanidesulfovibrio marinus]|nr:MFS transporter [Oceanidesulfovibrio marinus]
MSRYATRKEMVAWALYDCSNNGFVTPIQTFIFAAYFTKAVAENPAIGSAMWGNMISLAGLVVALGGPLLGAVADRAGRRKPWIGVFTALCIAATFSLWFVKPDPAFAMLALVGVCIGTIGSEYALIFYNTMLSDLVPNERTGRWSGWGWASGYIGGLACLLLAFFLLVGDNPLIPLGTGDAANVRATVFLAGGWYLIFALPLFLFTPDTPATGTPLIQAAGQGLTQLKESFSHVRRYKHIVRFLIARMIYNDGLATTFAFGGIYAAGVFGMSAKEVLIFGIVLNVAAGLGAFAFAWVDDWIGPKPTILLSLVGLLVPGTIMLFITSKLWFLVVGCVLGLFFGPVQSASRSYLARTAPPELRSQFFGLFALSGKLTSFAGPLLVGWLTYLSGSQRVGMSTVIFLFFAGGVMMLTVPTAAHVREEVAEGNPADSPQ